METASSLYSKLVELLGCPSSKHVELLIGVGAELNEQPVIEYFNEKYWEYSFEKSGIDLSYDNEKGFFDHLTLHIATPSVKEGGRKPYLGDLPFGVERNDLKDDVEMKLPGATMVIKDYRTDRGLRPFVFTAHF